MGELYNPFPKLPKNIRQIGERDAIVKLYVEDYVNTYLRRLYPAGGQDLRVGLLLGSVEMNDGTPYIFIDGAMEMEDVTEQGQKVVFSELAWKKAYQSVEQLFPKRSVLGWFLCGAPGNDLSPLNYWKQHVQYFQGPNKLMYLSSGVEGDESVYITSEDGFYKLCGYSIYYERNQMMQDYMVLRKDVRRIESGSDEKVIQEFRKRMDEHKDEVTDRHQTLGLLRGMCMAMSIVILAGGIVMFNNYERMQEMESVIASAIPERVESALMGKDNAAVKDKPESHVVVEEADGGVYPTTAAVTKETMSETQPGSQNGGEGQNGGDGQAAGSGQKSENTQDGGDVQSSGNGQNSGGSQNGESSQNSGNGQDGGNSQESAQTQGGNKGASKEEGAGSQSSSGGASQAAAGGTQRVHVVQDGETLYGICISEYHDVNKLKEICELNGLEDENKIVSGQKLLLP
ncbi:MAG: LysM peptidoglycan-binding domain-containing protein [Hungatella hathewayi]|uniref:LysM peptidoglycan-binding domain-containing protein n=1 Tax=Hungatella TaxID=1649459 RepID=UPI00110633D3|nr:MULTISPECIES: LysM domain-containing protein [Hungatella]MCI6453218.1 LysM peptidoglycan-binding domain-containing protein [Hungatella sp.]MCI7380982.1 LysM peptidoglycan-binding domain-containing protein [Hungatella sp.]MDY6236139.1 LysM peptidoglycan-binding domain-containing protein [Hungatella hathewayi]